MRLTVLKNNYTKQHESLLIYRVKQSIAKLSPLSACILQDFSFYTISTEVKAKIYFRKIQKGVRIYPPTVSVPYRFPRGAV